MTTTTPAARGAQHKIEKALQPLELWEREVLLSTLHKRAAEQVAVQHEGFRERLHHG